MITISQVKQYINYADSDLDSYFQTLVNQTENFIEEYCQQPIDRASVVNRAVGNGTVRLALPNTSPITDLTVRSRMVGGSTYTAVSGCEAVVIGGLPFVYNPNLFYADKIYEFSYTAGWDVAPDTLQRIAVEMVAVAYNEQSAGHGKGLLGLSSVSDNFSGIAKTTAFRNMWLDRWYRELSMYRIPAG